MLSNIKLQHILFLSFTLVASLPVVILGYWVQRVALEHEIATVEEKHLLVAKNVTRDISRYVMDVENSFNFVISNLTLKNKINNLGAFLKTLDIRFICIIDTNGNIITEVSGFPETKVKRNKINKKIWPLLTTTIIQAKQSNKITYTDLIRTSKNQTTFFLIKKMPNKQIAIAALSTDYIQEVQKQISFGRRGHVAIVDRTGRAIAHPVSDWVNTMKDMSFLPPVKLMKNGKTGVSLFYTPAMKGNVIAGYTVVPQTGWGVMVPQPFEELLEHASSNQNTALVIIIIGITAAGLISWFLSILLVGPIHAVVKATKFSDEEKHKFIMPVSTLSGYKFIPKEIKELIDSFNNMGKSLNSITKELYSKIDFSSNEVKEQNLKLQDQAHELKTKNEELKRLSTTDNLTSLFNRRLFDTMLETEFSFVLRHHEFLSLIMLDIDHFKSINDEFGHVQGDRVLIDIANILKDNIRTSDVAFRIGGEEFAILCRQTNFEDSKIMAENLRQALEKHEFRFKNKLHTITGSFGIITAPDTNIEITKTETFYRFADQAMYFSKESGRNVVSHYHDVISKPHDS
ncbi:MAG: diguanylate cyclase [Gammaproteobacteria bacterium]